MSRRAESNGMSRRAESWWDERMRWENAHPEWKPFREDSDSQRQLNQKEAMG